MAVLSELKLAAEKDVRLQSTILNEPPARPDYGVDEEFPLGFPGYDRMLQAPPRRTSDRLLRLVVVALTVLLIAFCLIYSLPKPFPSVVTSPSSSTSSSTPVSR